MTALLLVILVCFIVVAIKGLLDWRDVDRARPAVWCPRFRQTCPWSASPGRTRERPHAGDRHRRPGAAAGGDARPTGTSPTNAGQTAADIRPGVLEDGAEPRRHLGPVLGGGHRRRRHGAARRLHRLRARSISASATTRRFESIPVAGQVLGPAFPGALGFLAPRFFSLGLIAAAFTTLISVVADDDLLLPRHGAAGLALHAPTTRCSRSCSRTWIAVPALIAPFWQLPALLKAILAMVGNLLLAPIAVAVIVVLREPAPRCGEFKAGVGPQLRAGGHRLFALGAGRQRAAGVAAMSAAQPRRRRARHRGDRRRRRHPAARRRSRPRRRRTRWPTAASRALEVTMTVPGAVGAHRGARRGAAGERADRRRHRARSREAARSVILRRRAVRRQSRCSDPT